MEHPGPLIIDPADCRYLWRLHLRLAWRYFAACVRFSFPW